MRNIILMVVLVFFTSCEKESNSREKVSTVKFFDSAVENLKVVGSNSGVHLTNSDGEIRCETGETLDYYISNVKLGSSICDGKTHYPTTIIESNLNDINNTGPLAIGILLQSFNKNINLNKIKLPEEIHANDYSSLDLENSIDLNNNDIPDELESLMDEIKEKSPESNQIYTDRTLSDVLKHFKISFGSNDTYNLNITNTTEVYGIGTCPESISIKIKDEIIESSVIGGYEDISLSSFETTIESSRNMTNGDFLQILRSNDIKYASFYDCSESGTIYDYAEISIDGNVDPGNVQKPISGNYDFTIVCGQGIHTICEGTF